MNKGFLFKWREASGMSLAIAKTAKRDWAQFSSLDTRQLLEICSALVSWISRKELLCLSEQPRMCFCSRRKLRGLWLFSATQLRRPEMDWLALRRFVWAAGDTSQVPLSHMISFIKKANPDIGVSFLFLNLFAYRSSHTGLRFPLTMY